MESHNLTSYLPKLLLVLKDCECAKSDSNPAVVKRLKGLRVERSGFQIFVEL